MGIANRPREPLPTVVVDLAGQGNLDVVLLERSVQQPANRVFVALKVFDAKTGKPRWSFDPDAGKTQTQSENYGIQSTKFCIANLQGDGSRAVCMGVTGGRKSETILLDAQGQVIQHRDGTLNWCAAGDLADDGRDELLWPAGDKLRPTRGDLEQLLWEHPQGVAAREPEIQFAGSGQPATVAFAVGDTDAQSYNDVLRTYYRGDTIYGLDGATGRTTWRGMYDAISEFELPPLKTEPKGKCRNWSVAFGTEPFQSRLRAAHRRQRPVSEYLHSAGKSNCRRAGFRVANAVRVRRSTLDSPPAVGRHGRSMGKFHIHLIARFIRVGLHSLIARLSSGSQPDMEHLRDVRDDGGSGDRHRGVFDPTRSVLRSFTRFWSRIPSACCRGFFSAHDYVSLLPDRLDDTRPSATHCLAPGYHRVGHGDCRGLHAGRRCQHETRFAALFLACLVDDLYPRGLVGRHFGLRRVDLQPAGAAPLISPLPACCVGPNRIPRPYLKQRGYLARLKTAVC